MHYSYRGVRMGGLIALYGRPSFHVSSARLASLLRYTRSPGLKLVLRTLELSRLIFRALLFCTKSTSAVLSVDMPISGGITAAVPYVNENGVSSLLDFIIVRWYWTLDGSGEFSVASARKVIDDNRFPEVSTQTRWIKAVPIKVNIHAWKVRMDCLPTRLNISRRGNKLVGQRFASGRWVSVVVVDGGMGRLWVWVHDIHLHVLKVLVAVKRTDMGKMAGVSGGGTTNSIELHSGR
ncbi:hypothetical protein Tco_0683797 [Tanacetum coccineum]